MSYFPPNASLGLLRFYQVPPAGPQNIGRYYEQIRVIYHKPERREISGFYWAQYDCTHILFPTLS